MDKQALYLQRIREIAPALEIHTVSAKAGGGQFNAIVIVNDEMIFRFPKSQYAVSTMRKEVALLRELQHKTTLPVPDPIYVSVDSQSVEQNCMGYHMLPGTPLYRAVLEAIEDETVLDRLAWQIATFMRELHSLSTEALGIDVPLSDGRDAWQDMYQQFRERLFPYMRTDARAWVTDNFTAFLAEPCHFTYTPVLRHGDFGGSNILYDAETQQISGVIDFSFAAMGDPALDAAAISTLGDAFLQRISATYPEIEAMHERVQFYKSTYVLQQALYGLRDGDREAFEDGIAAYI